jgi:hypothetical protein
VLGAGVATGKRGAGLATEVLARGAAPLAAGGAELGGSGAAFADAGASAAGVAEALAVPCAVPASGPRMTT